MKELLGICEICGVQLFREDSDSWVYYMGTYVCTKHPGVQQWYDAMMRKSKEELENGQKEI